ncbi:Major facilitator superfamily domain-containing protein 10 [Smittium culicis]|uniref:Major facilitator superfamily domain-containing protein 10 n=1 Tax=Smittium culicis TaxID=133412 RepID=A0A1R1XWI4_9FUNG|nr:Major facilitator superfamily domain-containing protein 10 [Smittium culicis]
MSTLAPTQNSPPKILKVVIIALIIDIFAFTSILPLLPRTIEFFLSSKEQNPSATLNAFLYLISKLRAIQNFSLTYSYLSINSLLSLLHISPLKNPQFLSIDPLKSDIVLLGGLLGSFYSLLQCLVAPIFGKLSDKYGRRRILLFSMLGNLLSTTIWVFSKNFDLFLISRIIAGLSEANIQISTTVIADVSSPENRAKQMALVGISFSLGFTFGPLIGAYFASLPSHHLFLNNYFNLKLAPFANAALFSLALLSIETLYIYFYLPETLNYQNKSCPKTSTPQSATPLKLSSKFNQLLNTYFMYMFVFSGMEYSLTFLMHDLFNYSNRQQGYFLGSIGLTSALIQGLYVRKTVSKFGEKNLCLQGFAGCIFGMVSVVLLANSKSSFYLPAICLGFSIASAIVTSTMNAIISLLNTNNCSYNNNNNNNTSNNTAITTAPLHRSDSATSLADQIKPHLNTTPKAHIAPPNDSGHRLGSFRSAGQLGRAFGPGFACFLYWTCGPQVCYLVGSLTVLYVFFKFKNINFSLIKSKSL